MKILHRGIPGFPYVGEVTFTLHFKAPYHILLNGDYLNLSKIIICLEMTCVTYKASSELASVAQLDARPIGDQEVAGSTPPGRQHSFVEIDHEIFSTAILSLPLIQEVQLSVSGEIMCTKLVNRIADHACPR